MKHFWDDRLHRWGSVLIAVAMVVVIFVAVFKQISSAREARARKKDLAAGPRVEVTTAKTSPAVRELVLIGEARPFETAVLYAKVVGYIKSMRVDKGDAVRSGDLLAVIAAPENTHDYDQAVADARNKRAIAERYRPLLARQLVSNQEAEQAFADADAAEAHAASLRTLKNYQEIRAPFAGTVTARYADPGALVQSSALPLFELADLDTLRVFAYVDQRDAASIHNGLPVKIGLTERPDFTLNAQVTRFSGALDPQTRMLLVEVDVDNRQRQLVAGSYVQIAMKVQAQPYVEVPVEAVVQNQSRNFVQVVSSSQTIHYQEVALADNDGQMVKVLNGLEAGATVALNLGNTLPDGSRIQPMTASTAQASSGQAQGGTGAPGGSSSAGATGQPSASERSGGQYAITASSTEAARTMVEDQSTAGKKPSP